MAKKILARLGVTLAAACYAAAGPQLAQPHRGGRGGGGAPARHISAPAPHVSAPAPHFSAPHVSAPAAHFNAPRFAGTPHVNTPHFATRAPHVGARSFAPHGRAFTARNLARQTA